MQGIKRFLGAATGLAFVIGASAAANAAVMTFDNQTDWEAALGGAVILTENFDGAASNFLPNSNGNPAGLVTVDVIGVGTDPVGLTGTGFFQARVDSIDPALSVRFNRPNLVGVAIVNLQINQELDEELDLQEVGFEIGSEMLLLSDILGFSNPGDPGVVPEFDIMEPVPFIGFVVDTPVDNFLVKHGDLVRAVEGSNEAILIDSLLLAQAADQEPGDVPEPGLLGLLGLGLASLGLYRRRRPA